VLIRKEMKLNIRKLVRPHMICLKVCGERNMRPNLGLSLDPSRINEHDDRLAGARLIQKQDTATGRQLVLKRLKAGVMAQ